ncbi:MAG: swr complex subunit [Geoglossum simile]|nr:MAG: swr complex subunit [Geoglossum simile]
MTTSPIDKAVPPAAESNLDSSEDDEDFNPDAIPSAAAESLLSDSDSDFSGNEVTTKKPAGKKRKQANGGGEPEPEFASGDEATIRKGKRKKAKGAAADSDEDSDNQGGEGGLIKTRAQRAREKAEQRPLASAANATVDVDALWASMNTTTAPKPAQALAPTASHQETSNTNGAEASKDKVTTGGDPASQSLDETITIHRTYTFAGQTTTESQIVPKSSAAALLYLQSQSQPQSPNPPNPNQNPPLRRPKKRTSLFDPAGPGVGASAGATKAPKLNTIEKSKMDWAGYVDKEGLKEDLDEHSKAKEGYLGRMDFLGRVERKKDEEGRRARGLGL